eukprot:745280_1
MKIATQSTFITSCDQFGTLWTCPQMAYLSPEALQELTRYSYKYAMAGWIDRTLGTPFWNAVVKLCPLWLAPNLITLAALFHGILACILVFIYDSQLEGSAPGWVYFSCAYMVFAYQTLDAIDGKQARRTGSSSPLGQLFDHGCDALCCPIYSIILSSALGVGATNWTILLFVIHIVPFWVFNWEESVTHVMRFAAIGVTEAQLVIIAICCISGYFGISVFQTQIFGFEFFKIVIISNGFLVMYLVLESIIHVLNFCQTQNVALQAHISKPAIANHGDSHNIIFRQNEKSITLIAPGHGQSNKPVPVSFETSKGRFPGSAYTYKFSPALQQFALTLDPLPDKLKSVTVGGRNFETAGTKLPSNSLYSLNLVELLNMLKHRLDLLQKLEMIDPTQVDAQAANDFVSKALYAIIPKITNRTKDDISN